MLGALVVQVKVAECSTDCIPEPVSEIIVDGFSSLLLMVTLPDALPRAAGVNVAFSVAVCPPARMVPLGMPLALKPGPEMLTLEIVTLEPPELLSITPR